MRYNLKDNLHVFRTLQVAIAIVCIGIPALLQFADKDEYYPDNLALMNVAEMNEFLSPGQMEVVEGALASRFPNEFKLKHADSTMQVSGFGRVWRDSLGFRYSVSDYAYSSTSYLFGMLYMMAAMLYIYNGVVYRTNKTLQVNRTANAMNFLIGLFLIGVILNPASRNLLLHNILSLLFFGGNIVLMLFFPKENESRWFKLTRIAMAMGCLLALLGGLPFLHLYTLLWAEWIGLFIIASYLILTSVVVHHKNYLRHTTKEELGMSVA